MVVVVCESEVDESLEVDSGGAGGEPEPVALGAAAGASSVVANEPRNGAFGQVSAQLPGAIGATRFAAPQLCRTLRADLSTLTTRT